MTTTENWSWWVGHDEERFHTKCDSREEAVYIAREEYGGGWIVEAVKPGNIKLSGYFDVEDFLVRADECSQDDHSDPEGNHYVFEDTSPHCVDLEAMVRATIDQWQDKHGLVFTGWAFQAIRNLEYIPCPTEEQ